MVPIGITTVELWFSAVHMRLQRVVSGNQNDRVCIGSGPSHRAEVLPLVGNVHRCKHMFNDNANKAISRVIHDCERSK